MGFLYFLVIGAVAGWLAGQLTRGHGFGLLGDIVVGIIGAMVGGFLFGLIGLRSYGLAGAGATRHTAFPAGCGVSRKARPMPSPDRRTSRSASEPACGGRLDDSRKR
jgi:uncharacterized membrane protein YeaQ/YmgE (transglycosylase-associated protein family)